MRRSNGLILFVAVAFVVLCAPVSAQVPTLPPDGGTRIDPPTCSLQNAAGLAATEFRTSEEFVLSGTKFPADELVLVTFRQPPRVVELDRFRTDAQGTFTSRPTILRIPADAVGGPAAIRVTSSGGSATCDLRVAAASPAAAVRSDPEQTVEDEEGDLGLWFVVWGILLAIGACFLGYLRYRRWQEGRLEREMSQLNSDPRRGRVFKTDTALTRKRTEQRRPERKRLRLGDVKRASSPPVLRPGWDVETEPPPVRPPQSHHD